MQAKSESDIKIPDKTCTCRPLVIVEGFLGRSSPTCWGDFEQFLRCELEGCTRKAIFTSVGPVSSLHDRACELYYSLASGRVDYGEEHSKQHGHARYGRTCDEGLYPQWSQRYPLHFLGHSVGGPTILKLQHLLKSGHFGDHAHPDMILSVNTVFSPFRGTQLVYTLGERVDAAPAVRPLSWGAFIAKGVHIVSYLSPFLPRILDLHTDSRALSFNDISFLSFLKQLWRSDWAESRDATPYDVTFAAADEREAEMEGKTWSQTFYRSFSGAMTHKNSESNQHLPTFGFGPIPLYFTSRAIGTFDFSQIEPPPSFLKQCSPTSSRDLERGEAKEYESLSEQYYANDGVVPVFSQWHPYSCSVTECQHSKSPTSNNHDSLQPGVWYVHEIEDAHHLSLVPSFLLTTRQRQYWIDLGQWLTEIDRRTA
ncbi:alpha/beta-hydrolase [Marasmius fiardii PR-910]|nr:alpha/beta-hydrolase [Marasmius fiardii PR-910]